MEETGEREMEMRDGTGGTGKSRREKGQEISITALPITPSNMGLCLQGNGERLEKLRDGESQDKSKSEKRKGNISSHPPCKPLVPPPFGVSVRIFRVFVSGE